MKTIVDYLDDLKEKTGSDYKTAQLLEIQKTAVSMIRKRGQLADETAVKIADLLGIDRTELLIAAAIARNGGEVKTAWIDAAKRMGMAASIALPMLLISSVYNNTKADGWQSQSKYVYYVKLIAYLKRRLIGAIIEAFPRGSKCHTKKEELAFHCIYKSQAAF